MRLRSKPETSIGNLRKLGQVQNYHNFTLIAVKVCLEVEFEILSL